MNFSKQTIDHLGYYVYALVAIEDNKETIFYIGKGKGDGVFSHFKEVNKIDFKDLEKDAKIKNIKIKNNDCKAYILEAGLNEEEALKTEALLISVLNKFPNSSLSNVVSGHHEFQIDNVYDIDLRYSKPIDLGNFCKENNINVLVLKSTLESYEATKNNDFRGVLEGIWLLNHKNLKKVDYLIGAIESKIYAIYKIDKSTIKKIGNMKQEDLDKWNIKHINMGRPAKYAKTDHAKIEQCLNKTVFELKPIAIPLSQKVCAKKGTVNSLDKKVANKLLNTTITGEKIKTRSSRCYFWSEQE